jgi:hypothetical protein
VNVRLTRACREFYLMAQHPDSMESFKTLEARLLVRHIEPNPSILHAHNVTLDAGGVTKYHLTSVDVKTFTFAAGSHSLSIDNEVLGPLPKQLLFTLVKNEDYLGTLNTNPYHFRHYGIQEFELYVNGRQIPSEGLHIITGREKTTVMRYLNFSKLQVFGIRKLDSR